MGWLSIIVEHSDQPHRHADHSAPVRLCIAVILRRAGAGERISSPSRAPRHDVAHGTSTAAIVVVAALAKSRRTSCPRRVHPTPTARIAAAFDRSHSGRIRNAVVDQIYRAAFGDDYPGDAQPSAFYSRTTLQRLAQALHIGPGDTVVDLGCGHGGPSVWIAQQTGAILIGLDLSPVGIDLARRRAVEMGLSAQTRFEVGDATATGLPDACCDAAMSLDVLWSLTDKAAAVHEVARILRPGGRFAFTTWEQIAPAALQPHPLLDAADTAPYHPLEHRHLLEEAGLMVDTYEEPPQWRRQQQALVEGIIAAEAEVTADMGAHYPAMARSFLANLPTVRYLFIVTHRPLPASA